MPAHPTQNAPLAPDFSELLRQTFSGLAPNDLLGAMLDRLEGRT
ncbi:MAG: hypothetical protein ACK4VZ_04685 [Paracoccaceae bacterium]